MEFVYIIYITYSFYMRFKVSSTDTYNKINKLINSSRYNESFLLLKNLFKNYNNLQKEKDKLLETEKNYQYMLDFLSTGNSDPEASNTLAEIRKALRKANDIIYRETNKMDSSDLYSSSLRLVKLRNHSFDTLLQSFTSAFQEDQKTAIQIGKPMFSKKQENALNDLFLYIWVLNNEDSSEYDSINSTLLDSDQPEYLKSLILSAVILSNTSFFDPDSFELILNLYDNTDSVALKAKAITGIILISLLHSKRIEDNIRLRSRLFLSAQDPELNGILNNTLLSIIQTYDTTRIDNKMRNDVLPGLMKMNPDIIEKMRNMSTDSDNFLSDDNPDWEDFIENSEIGKKIQEINDLQLEGADVMATAFSNLKSFPFFNNISNWFTPYINGNYQFDGFNWTNEDDVENISAVMCTSDLHSFLLSVGTLPDDKRNMMIGNMLNQIKEAREGMSNSIGESETQLLNKKIKHSLQDIYRFHKFFPKKADFNDPFALPFLKENFAPLINILGLEPENIRLIAEFYLKNKYYEESANMFELVNELTPGNYDIWEKIGYGLDKTKQYELASQWYKKAELVNPGDNWLTKQLAVSLKNAGKPKEALEYYNLALGNDPENYHLIMSAAQCQIDCDNFEEARKHLFHAQYLKPQKLAPLRAQAWVELLDGNLNKAQELYVRIMVHPESDKIDFLNAAHSYLAAGNFKDALKCYRTFVDKSENQDIKNLVLAFRDDAETLKKINIHTQDLRLIIDKLRYDLFG